MPNYGAVIRPGSPNPDSQPQEKEPTELDAEQCKELAALIVKHIPMEELLPTARKYAPPEEVESILADKQGAFGEL